MSAETPNQPTKLGCNPRPSTRQRAGVRFRRPPAHQGPQIHLQHAAWADAIRAKFLPRKQPGAHPETYVFLRIAGGMRLLLRERCIMQQFALPGQATLLRQIQWKEVLVSRRPQEQNLSAPIASRSQSLSFREAGRSGFDLLLRDKQPLGAGPHDAGGPGADPVRTGKQKRSLQPHPGTGFIAPVVRLLRRNPPFRTTTAQDEPPGRESNLSNIARRIVRQLQRVETVAMAHQSARELKYTAGPPGDVAWMPPADSRKRQIEQEESRAAKEQTPAPPVINVAQITENVLQQLDRRLIAARERMGRI
jgi:hypothetical protein